ncbi:MAG TPA: hypothetical protein ENK57_25090 [Polyangiaceae bacterium]|nr:hypothetical protein [Polyangiaceae bacterium]
MSRAWASTLLVAALAAPLPLATGACATYRDDLDRAVAAYNDREYERAVALFDLVEPDLDSLSVSERARYAYYRGMAHYLSDQRRDARHWLGNAAAREKASEGSLHPEEAAKMNETLEELNQDRWGGASTPGAEAETCEADRDCVKGQFCDDGTCRDAPGADGADDVVELDDKKGGKGESCRGDADCASTLVCKDGTCSPPK